MSFIHEYMVDQEKQNYKYNLKIHVLWLINYALDRSTRNLND